MGSDRARVSYDPRRQYRSVVMQQGRVTLEADWNEAQQITEEEIRCEALDVLGPSGTPDNGYSVVLTPQPASPFDFYVDSGTMYVGGVRAYLDGSVLYSNQSDWRDRGPDDPDWVDLSMLAANPPTDEFVYLYLREQEVSAVEDPDLKDVALGGPDTAQRTRLLQHIVRVASPGTDCVSGLSAAEAKWASEGLTFDPNTMRLRSWSRLEVGFSDQSQTQNPCQPQGQGGYLGPDNQMIRVQISGVDKTTGNPKFVWGFDDASFLYRIQVDPGNAQQLDLQTIPVDAEHQPAAGQAVEVLRTAADLSNGGNVASASGFVFTLAQNYDPDSQSIQIPTGITLPDAFTFGNQSPPSQLFLRVWQQEIIFVPGLPARLGNTGLTVTLRTRGNAPFHTGDYWMFAVRPATPQAVYPERYQNDFQPPDGPRLWACPLGVIAWSDEVGRLASDCRNFFDNLVNLTKRAQGCCSITVRPQDLSPTTTLQSIVNGAGNLTMLVKAANAGARGNNITVEISNVQLNVFPPVFDLTVSETDLYLGLTTNNIAVETGTETGGPNTGLVHVLTNSINNKLAPLANQNITLAGGGPQANAQANVMDTGNTNVVFTLQARNPGADGNITAVNISNVDTTQNPPTFNLTVTWTRTLPGLSMADLFSSIRTSLGYVIRASPPLTAAPAFPTPGITTLAGGIDPGAAAGATTAQGRVFGVPNVICLKPGSYLLSKPLVLGPEQSNITIESCGGAATLGVVAGKENNFLQGLVQLNGASGISLRGLVFAMPQVSLYRAGGDLAGLTANTLAGVGEAGLASINSSVGLMAVACQNLTIADCIFTFPGLELNDVLFGAAILASGDCSGITLDGNEFQGPASVRTLADPTGSNFSVALAGGFVQSDTVQFTGANAGRANLAQAGIYVPSSLDNLSLSGNTFTSLAFPVVISSTLGSCSIDRNVITSCLTGFTLVPLTALAQAATQAAPQGVDATSISATRLILSNDSLQRMLSIAAAYPKPASLVPARRITLAMPVKPAPAPKPAPAADVTAPPPPAPILDPGTFKPITAGVAGFINRLPAIVFERPLFRIQFTDNQVDAMVTGGASSWALAIMNLAPNTTALGMLTLAGNQMRNASAVFNTLAMVDVCTATGNTILNQLGRGKPDGFTSASLIIANTFATRNTALAAVTGNVLEGPATLPARTIAGLPAWTTYNTII